MCAHFPPDGQASEHVDRGERDSNSELAVVHAERKCPVASAAVPFLPCLQQRGRCTAGLPLLVQWPPPDRGHRLPHGEESGDPDATGRCQVLNLHVQMRHHRRPQPDHLVQGASLPGEFS